MVFVLLAFAHSFLNIPHTYHNSAHLTGTTENEVCVQINRKNDPKKSETADCQHSEKKRISKTHKRLKECFIIRQTRTKHAHFPGSPLF